MALSYVRQVLFQELRRKEKSCTENEWMGRMNDPTVDRNYAKIKHFADKILKPDVK